MELLLLLVERRGRLVTRNEILERLWGADVFRDVDHSINTAIRKIRLALKDDPERPRLLFTVPGKGYRFLADVIPPSSPSAGTGPPTRTAEIIQAVIPSPSAVAAPAVARPRWPLIFAAAAGLMILTIVAWISLPGHATRASGKTMLVVMPFANLSGDLAQEYFADGMTEELITQLGGLDPERLGVIARTSTMQYKGTKKSAAQIGRELGVQYLFEGSVRRSNGRGHATNRKILLVANAIRVP